MIAAFTLLYTVIVLVLFKCKLVKPRPLPIVLNVVAGVLIIGGIVVAWSLGAPMSSRVVTTQYVIQLVPYVKGQVKKIHAVANQPVKKGDLPLEINPEPYQYTVNQLQGQLQAAQDNVKQAGAGLQAAQANVVKSKAGVTQARAATGEGQFDPSGQIPYASKIGSQGLLAVKIRLTDEHPPPNLPLGAGGAVAIYTSQVRSVHIISKVAIRMKKWALYVIPS
jgi:multidrug efflux pump subunit AcrA (membrane-fusion protein)